MNRRIINTCFLAFFFTIASCSNSKQTQADREVTDAVNTALSSSLTIQTSPAPKNVILLIPDGFGPASLTAAREYHGSPLNLDSIISGVVKTRATDSPITDSAASATAYATGHRTYNGAIAVDVNKRPLATILEGARAKGMKTGLVATSTITHATPASFASHVPSRSMQEEIAPQILEREVDVIFGGGIEYFQPINEGGRRKDNRDLISEAKKAGYQFVTNEKEMSALTDGSALGLFSRSHMAYDIDRERTEQPSLRDMLVKAIELLDGTDEGFFLMVEASRIDHAGHGNDIAAHLGDIMAFDEAVGAAKDFADSNGETLLVSVADHETGGLSVGRKVGSVDHYNWLPDEIKKITASIAFINAEGRRTNNPDSAPRQESSSQRKSSNE